MKRNTLLLCTIPAAICLILLGTYLISPDFFLKYILRESGRETMLVEIVTVIAALGAALLLFISAGKYKEPNKPFFQQTSIFFLLIVGLAAFVLGGEEVSWGQTWFGWETPEAYAEHSVETNLHNTDIPVQSLGSAFLALVFIVFPLVSKVWRNKPTFFQPLEKTVPGVLAISFVATGFVWKGFKSIYRAVTPESMQLKYSPDEPLTFYGGFLEQINEQKEMLMALALLAFAFQIFSARTADFRKKIFINYLKR